MTLDQAAVIANPFPPSSSEEGVGGWWRSKAALAKRFFIACSARYSHHPQPPPLKRRGLLRAAIALLLGFAGSAQAQEQGEPPVAASAVFADSPRPQQPPGQTLPYSARTPGMRRLVTDVTRGTWMSLDVAPDGRTLVMDILGDLYRLPVAGGRATRITSGVPFDTQPTYSRDGQWLAFVSDRSGADNLWIARPDGAGARQISFGDDDSVLVSPAWAPDGQAIYVSRYRPDLNNYELWRYDLNGKTTLVVPIRDTPATPRDAWRSTLYQRP